MPDLEQSIGLPRTDQTRAEILTTFKARGLTITEAIKASMQLFGLGLGDAKLLVASHPSWTPVVEAAGPIHDDLVEAFREVATPGPTPTHLRQA